ncbi:MAG: hypothetical protein WD907_04515 [Bacilli bacterium]
MKKTLIALVSVAVVVAIGITTVTAQMNNSNSSEPIVNSETSSPTPAVDTTSSSSELLILGQSEGLRFAGIEFTELIETVKINNSTAMEVAAKTLGDLAKQTPEKISATLAKFTDIDTQPAPDSNIILKDLPVWVVTYYGINMPRNGKAGVVYSPVYADTTIIIDANTGEMLEMIARPHGK